MLDCLAYTNSASQQLGNNSKAERVGVVDEIIIYLLTTLAFVK